MACERKSIPSSRTLRSRYVGEGRFGGASGVVQEVVEIPSCPDRNQFNQTTYDNNELNSFINDHKERGYPFISRTKFPITPYKNSAV